MNSLIFAGIDPGGTTGLAIARVLITEKELCLKQLELLSLKKPDAVFALIDKYLPSSIIMERRANNSSSTEGVQPYEVILATLQKMRYNVVKKGFKLVPDGITLINPGVWKPFMEAQDVDRGHWLPSSPHERDALNLLHYGLKINSPRKKVEYE